MSGDGFGAVIKVSHDVTIGIIVGAVSRAYAGGDLQESADAAGALRGAGEIEPPQV